MSELTVTAELDLPLPPEAAWKVVADTARVNLEAGNPTYVPVEEVQPDGTVLRRAKGTMALMKAEWEERYGEWVAPRWTLQERIFHGGPLRRLRIETHLRPQADGHTHLTLESRISGRGPIGFALLRLGILRRLTFRYAHLIRQLAEAEAAGGSPTPGAPAALQRPALPAEAERRLRTDLAALSERHDPALVARLERLLREAAETELGRLRPLALARAWSVPADRAIALCLDAHRQGLLALRWELLCPRCRGAKAAVGNLYEMPRGVHCPSCNIDYERDFSRNVELVFQPEAWLRPLAAGAYCLLGPGTTPHVKLQRRLEPGESLVLEAELPPGPYRLRTVEAGPDCEFDWDGEAGFPEILIEADAVRAGPPAPPGRIAIRNASAAVRHAVVEERHWLADALTGDRVIALPAFRELCPEQVIRPGDEVGIALACIMFADLKGSTALYARLGDAAAYGLVRDYFGFFAERLRAEGGVLVKTMGDAVMAAFAEPGAAVAAALAIHRDAAAFGRGQQGARPDAGLVTKIGLHAGPCVAVNTSGLLDYFGRTVNLAARLQTQSDGGDIVLSRELAEDPAAAALLAGLPAEDALVPLRGIPEPVQIRRVRPGERAAA